MAATDMQQYVRPFWARLFPERARLSLLLTAILSAGAGILDVLLATTVLRDYGLVLFLVTPCALGFAAPLLHGMGAPRSFWQCLGAAVLSQVALFAGMVIFAIEGVICIVMAAPLWFAVAVIGATAAYFVQRALWERRIWARGFPIAGLLLLCVIPGMMGAERAIRPEAPLLVLTTSIEIDAPPIVVWNNLLSYPQIPPQRNMLTRLGLAYPVCARVEGQGVGAKRYCVFSTGEAPETVTKWNPAAELEFDVHATPPPMIEWSPYPHVHPPHLEGYLTSEHARFVLTPLPGGRTRLTGTSWYRNRIFPITYWRLWSDRIIRKIHVTVLGHVKARSEEEKSGGSQIEGVQK